MRIRQPQHQRRQIKQLASRIDPSSPELNPFHSRRQIAFDAIQQIDIGRQSPAISDVALQLSV